MKNKQKDIEQFDLAPEARAGIFLVNMKQGRKADHGTSKPHRDNHFLLMFAIAGEFRINVDFEELKFRKPTLLLVFPDQVHHIVEAKKPAGWIISFDPSVVDNELKQFFENKLTGLVSLNAKSSLFSHLAGLMKLIEDLQLNHSNNYTSKSINAALDVLLNLVASEVAKQSSGEHSKSRLRGEIIKDSFNQLLKKNFKTWKQPAQYASALSISVSHLNDTVKMLTGFSVSIHIQQATLVEAKRQLCFTDKSVKEIGYAVGYDDPVYFGRFFRKMTKHTPLEFREQFRD